MKNAKRLVLCLILSFCFVAVAPLTALAWDLDIGRVIRVGRGIRDSLPMNEETEIALGQNVARKMIARYGLYEDPAAVKYINLIGKALVLGTDRQDYPYTFNILDSMEINAFSCPGGQIFITRGLWEAVVSEAELAGILGHEIAHVTRRHVVKEVQKSNFFSMVTEEALNEVGGEQFNQIADHIVDNIFANGFSRSSEYEADKLGTTYAAQLGYYPAGLAEFLARDIAPAEDDEEIAGVGALYRGHPPVRQRVSKLDDMIEDDFPESVAAPQLAERLHNRRGDEPAADTVETDPGDEE